MARAISFRDLDVYKLARQQSKTIFELTVRFPKAEQYSLTDQVRRSSRAVNAMIGEAWAKRRYVAAFANKLNEAQGEAMETQVWLDHALDCRYLDSASHATLDDHWQHVGAMLNRMIDRADEFCRRGS